MLTICSLIPPVHVCVCAPGVVEYLSNGGVAENHKDFKELRYNECLTNFSCNGNSDGSITHSFQLKSAYDSILMPYTNYTYDFKVAAKLRLVQRPSQILRIHFTCHFGVKKNPTESV